MICQGLAFCGAVCFYFSRKVRKTLVQATVLSRIDYCNSLLFGLPVVHLSKLQRLQNAAARLVCNIPKYDHITPALIRLHWLPVQFRIEFKVAMLVYKFINGTAPQYLKDLTINREISRYSLRSNKGILLVDNSCSIKCPFFIRICFKFGTDGLYCVTKGKIRLFSFGFCVRAAFLFSNLTSEKVS